ncbi:MAG: hypothetical protein WDN50_07950 [Bradyrhizobium sp.]
MKIVARTTNPNVITAAIRASLQVRARNQKPISGRAAKDQPSADSLFQHGSPPSAGIRRFAWRQHQSTGSQRTNPQAGSVAGGALFERHGDGVTPTAKGGRFASIAALIEPGFRRLTTEDENAVPPQSRRLAVGILPSVQPTRLLVNQITEAVLDIQTRHPALKLIIQEAPNSTLQDWVMRGLVGVAIVETVLPHMPRLPLGSSKARGSSA